MKNSVAQVCVHFAMCINVILYRKPCDLKIRVGRGEGGVNWAENLQGYIAHSFFSYILRFIEEKEVGGK